MNPDFEKGDDLIPTVIQDDRTKEVLMLGYINDEAFERTKAEGLVTFYSRSKNRLWTKGETSGNHLKFVSAKLDCDRDTLLIKAIPSGPVCHQGTETCFGDKGAKGFMYELEATIKDRKDNPLEGSYTTSLFEKGMNKIAQKVGEEAVELVIEAKDNNDDLFKNEAADLMYHFLILLEAKGFALKDIEAVLQSRQKG
ncbi:bifunctional phosphoribosyl-AMP cyclohydrolase/phosphoribosyl-ATP diphosphatase HisIE [Cryomorphaceae bacterium 1068]|nr:bifunctional phosphoribosyl-AMP cyclohydrolase/phosphoribosyl-ATP diphosphatase HisIE [Cryomorphaceae bacterium 1068]